MLISLNLDNVKKKLLNYVLNSALTNKCFFFVFFFFFNSLLFFILVVHTDSINTK